VYYAGAAHAILDDWAQGSRLLADSLEAGESGHLPWSTPNACLHYGRFLLASGDTARAEEVLTKGYTLAYEKGSLVQELNLLPLLCELHLKTGRLEQAELDLKRAQEILARRQPWRGLAAPIHLAEGMLATARGNWTEAEQAFGQALEMEGAYGFPYNEGRALFEWGEMYLKRNSRGDREKGMELLDQALAIYQRCAARNDVEKVLARKELLRA
jgi:tetratricopeptide (TPR) repeat protein